MNHRRVAVGLMLLAGGACADAVSPMSEMPVARVQISAARAQLDVGETLQLEVHLESASGEALNGHAVEWSSSDTAVAVVAEGRVTGRAPGRVRVVATAEQSADTVELAVEEPVATLRVGWDSLTLIQGRSANLWVEMMDGAGRPQPHSLTVVSSAVEVATVNAAGEVHAVTPGTALLKVTAGVHSVQVPVQVVSGEHYRIVDLGSLGGGLNKTFGSRSVAKGLNNRGEVVGGAMTAAGEWHAFRWHRGSMTDLGVIGPPGSWTQAEAVNDSGTVVGNTWWTSNDGFYSYGKGWAWSRGLMEAILPDEPNVTVTDINNRGQVVGSSGSSYWKNVGGRAFRREAGHVTWLEPFGMDPKSGHATGSFAEGINDAGTIVLAMVYGNVMGPPIVWKGYTWRDGAYTLLGAPVAGIAIGVPTDVNNRGEVIGSYTSDVGTKVGVIWEGQAVTSLAPMSTPAALNDNGDVVGGRYLRRSGQVRDPDDLLISAGWEIVSASAINELGQIAGTARNLSTREVTAVLLIPAP